MGEEDCSEYDVIYLCGGSASYLMQRMNEAGFHRTIHSFIRRGGVVLGGSAGSNSSEDARVRPVRYPRNRSEVLRLGNRQGMYFDEHDVIVFE